MLEPKELNSGTKYTLGVGGVFILVALCHFVVANLNGFTSIITSPYLSSLLLPIYNSSQIPGFHRWGGDFSNSNSALTFNPEPFSLPEWLQMCSNSCSQTCTNAFTHANPNDKLEIPEKSLDTGWVFIYFILFILVNVMYRAVDGLLSESDGATSWTGGHDSSSYGSAKLDRQISTFLFSAASHIDSQSVNSLEFFDEEYELWFRRILMLKTLNVHRFTLVVTGFVLPFCFFTISASSSPNLLYSLIVLGITTVTLPLSKTSIYFSNELLFNDFLGTGVVVNAIGVLLNAFAGRFNGNAIHPFIVLAMVIFNAYLIMFMSGNVWVRKTLNLASMLFVYVVGTVFYRVPCYNKSSEASYPIVGVIPTLEYARFSFSCDPELDRLYMTIEVSDKLPKLQTNLS